MEKFVKTMKFQNIITDKTDETRRRVTCTANAKMDVDIAKDTGYLMMGSMLFKDVVVPEGKITEQNIEEKFVKFAEKDKIKGDMSEAQKEEIREEAREFKKMASEFAEEMVTEAEERGLRYTAQRTDDGKLIAKTLDD